MCRIAGWTGKLSSTAVRNLFLAMEPGNPDAAGMAWFDGREIHTLKGGVTASDFIKSSGFQRQTEMLENSEVVWGLLHTRHATNGSPKVNLNNHPIYNQAGLIIHNGVVYPDKWLPAQGECDSEQILIHVQKYGWKEGIAKLRGWMAVAYVDLHDPGTLYLYRSTSPLVGGITKRGVRFASSNAILKVLGYRGDDFEEGIVYQVKGRKVLEQLTEIKTKTYTFVYDATGWTKEFGGRNYGYYV